MEHDKTEKNEQAQDKSRNSKDQLHLSSKFGRKVIEMQMLLLSKQVAWKGEELDNLYDYVFKKYIDCLLYQKSPSKNTIESRTSKICRIWHILRTRRLIGSHCRE